MVEPKGLILSFGYRASGLAKPAKTICYVRGVLSVGGRVARLLRAGRWHPMEKRELRERYEL